MNPPRQWIGMVLRPSSGLSADGVSSVEFREQRGIMVPGQERFDAMGHAHRGCPGVVDDSTPDSGPSHEAIQAES